MMAWNGALRSRKRILGQVKGERECKSCSIIASFTLVCVAMACVCFNWNQIWVQWATPKGSGVGQRWVTLPIIETLSLLAGTGDDDQMSDKSWSGQLHQRCTKSVCCLFKTILPIKVCAEWVIDCTNTRHLPERLLTTWQPDNGRKRCRRERAKD